MPFEGPQLQPQDIARELHKLGFRDFDLVEMTATILGESQGFQYAYHDNMDAHGKIKTRDVGLAQINIPARYIGTKKEQELYKVGTNLRAARALFMTRETLTKRRRFNPWYAFTTGWATFPEWWVFTKAEPRHWAPTGRYLHQAVVGVANFYASELGIEYPRPFLRVPPAPLIPSKRPPGDGPRPAMNHGRGTLGS